MNKIGFIGLGHMGRPMVINLLKAGFSVSIFDVNQEALLALADEGALICKSPKELAIKSNTVMTSLQTGDQVKSCCLGENGIFENLPSGSIYIDLSSIDVHSSKMLHQKSKALNIHMLDAPVSGGVISAQQAKLTIMAGGEAEVFKKAHAVLSILGQKIIHTGDAGTGSAAKICNNMMLAINMIAVSEGFILADKLGLQPEKLFEVCSSASAQSWSLTHYCPWPDILAEVPSSHNYQPGFMAKMMLKDLLLSQDAANYVKQLTPLGKRATDLYQDFVDDGNGEIDFSAIIQWLKEFHLDEH